MTDRIRVTLTNLEPGPRGLETGGGLLLVDAGAEIGVELGEGDLDAAARTGWFVLATAEAAPPPKKRAR